MSISDTSYDPYDLRVYTLTPVPTGNTVCITGSHSACVSYIPNHSSVVLCVCMGCVHMRCAVYTVGNTPCTTITRMYPVPYPESLWGITWCVARTCTLYVHSVQLTHDLDPMDQGLCMCHIPLLPVVLMSMYGHTAYPCCST